jgi:putative two-component system response regulator
MQSANLTAARILVVDDQVQNLKLLEKILARAGYETVTCVADSRRALEAFQETDPDIVLLDLHMPHLDGFALLQILREHVDSREFLPILVLTGDITHEAQVRALRNGATDFVVKPVRPVSLTLRIGNMLETRRLHEELRGHAETLEQRVVDRTQELESAQLEIVHRLALAAEFRDDNTGKHAARVGELSARIGEIMGLDKRTVDLLRLAAQLHDLGKIGVPDSVLLGERELSDLEWSIMRSHATVGAEILSGTSNPLLVMSREICWSHHERWDGSGYPNGLAGTAIPLSGRIVAVADTFDAIISHRSYKDAEPVHVAISVIVGGSGELFDPRVVDAFMAVDFAGEEFLSDADDYSATSPRIAERVSVTEV